jgi:chromosome segregation ATPase
MDESWNHLQNLEAHIKEHNSHIEKITPLRTKQHSRQSSLLEDLTKRSTETPSTAKLLSMAKDLREKDLQIMYLKSDVASLEIYKDQCLNMQNQVKLLREKAVLCERESQSKTSKLSNLETTAVPRLEQLESDLKDLKSINENLQSVLSQTRKDLEEKTSQVTSLKQATSGQDSSIKSLEEEKRQLKGKLAELQQKLDELIRQHEKNKEYLKQKEQLSMALEEDNERLRAQIENTMESLQKCQYEISLLPMLRQDVHHREQLISTASREIEREKSLRQKMAEDKEKLEIQLANLYEITEGTDPFEYLQELKEIIGKSKKEHLSINEELVRMKETHYKYEKDNSELLEYTSTCIENFCKFFQSCLFDGENVETPELDESVKLVIEPLYLHLKKAKNRMEEIICELQDTNEILKEKNSQIRKRMEETEEMIIKQEFLTEQLTQENKKIKKELESLREDLVETNNKAETAEIELNESLKTSEALKKNYFLLKKELEDKVSALTSAKQNNFKQENLIEQIDDEKRYIESEKNTLEDQIKILENQKKILEEEKKIMMKKFSEIQKEFETFIGQHEKNTKKTKELDEVVSELKDENDVLKEEVERSNEANKRLFEENERMSRELENQIEKIEECQNEIINIPKMKQEIKQQSQQIVVLTLELEKEKENLLKSQKNSKNLEEKLTKVKTAAENNDPSELIQTLKSEKLKLTQENSSLKQLLEKTEKNYIDLGKTFEKFEESVQEMLKTESEKVKKFFLSQIPQSSYEGKLKQIYSTFFSLISYLHQVSSDKIADLEENIEYLSERVAFLETNPELMKKIEQTDDLIEKQEILSQKLSSENARLRQDFEFAQSQLEENARTQEDLEEKLQVFMAKNLKIKKKCSQLQKELTEKSLLVTSLSQSGQKHESLLKDLETDRLVCEEEKERMHEKLQLLKEEKKILIEEKKELDSKIFKLQNEFEKIFEKQENNLMSITNKKDLVTAMVEDNNRLKKHVQNLLEILKKYRA